MLQSPSDVGHYSDGSLRFVRLRPIPGKPSRHQKPAGKYVRRLGGSAVSEFSVGKPWFLQRRAGRADEFCFDDAPVSPSQKAYASQGDLLR